MLVKVTINALRLAEVIIDMVLWHYNLPNFIINDRQAIFIFKFWFSFYYFLNIKR